MAYYAKNCIKLNRLNVVRMYIWIYKLILLHSEIHPISLKKEKSKLGFLLNSRIPGIINMYEY